MSETFNPYLKLKGAARGDLESLRELAVAGALYGAEDRDLVSMVEGMTFARLAHAMSGDEGDLGVLLMIMGMALSTFPEREEECEVWGAEAIALTSILADEGPSNAEPILPLTAETVLSDLVAAMPKETAILARDIETLMKEEELA